MQQDFSPEGGGITDCTTCQEQTKLYLEDRLPQKDILPYCEHLKTCPACRDDLYINYAIVTALKQLNEDGELSSDYVKEVDQKLAASEARIKRSGRIKIYRRIAIALEILGIAAAMALFTPVEKDYAFLPEDSDSRVIIEYYGVPSFMDPVLKGIYRYNDDVIDLIRKSEREQQAKQEESAEDGLSPD